MYDLETTRGKIVEDGISFSGWIKSIAKPECAMHLYHSNKEHLKAIGKMYQVTITWKGDAPIQENVKELESGLDHFFGAVNYFNKHGKYPDA